MSLMKLTPETVRLRRIAKAHAAGEFSQHEYRSARREVIVNFTATTVDDDDTQPRQIPKPGAEQDYPGVTSRRRPGWKLWLSVTLLLLGLLLAVRSFADFADIGPVALRDPNPVTSPRLAVAEVRVSNFELLPGISAEALQQIIDEQLQMLRARHQAREHGFTAVELEEVGRLLKALGAHQPDTTLGARDAADLSALIATQKLRRGFSVVELEEVAAAVQAYYREAGYLLAVAYLPAQSVADGRAAIEVLPGVVGDVVVSGGGSYVARRFADLVGEPLTREVVTTRLYGLNQTPGRHADISFEPGAEVGEALLNVEVVERTDWSASLALDNYGDEATGEQRLLATASWLNPTGRGDVLDLGFLASLEGGDQLFGHVGYEIPFAGQYVLRGRAARNDFDAHHSTGAVTTQGEGWLFDMEVGRALHRDRKRGLSYELGASYHQLDWNNDLLPGLDNQTQDVLFATSAITAHRVWDSTRIAGEARVYADLGRIEGDTFAGQDATFWDLGVEAFAWRPVDVPVLPGVQKVSAELLAQLTTSQLPSTRRFTLGGMSGARGYDRDVYLADRGALLRLDVRTPLSLGELVLFADAAYGETLNDLDDTWGQVASLGISWETVLRGVESRLSWAVPVATSGRGDLDEDGAQIFWSFRYAR